MQNEFAAVATVAQGYLGMLYNADVAEMQRIFYPEALVQSLSGDNIVSLDLEAFKKRMQGRPVPREVGDSQNGIIDCVDFASPTCAHVKLHVTMLKTHFTDYLTVLKSKGQWRIISKAFHAQPQV